MRLVALLDILYLDYLEQEFGLIFGYLQYQSG